jgi:hypothetical protein
MSSWINLSAIWKIVVFGLLAGAGLPALFAIGMTSLSRGSARSPRGATATAAAAGPGADAGGGGGIREADVLVGGSVIGMMIAAICFLIVLAAIGWGIFEIYQSGHPAK